MFTFIAFVFTIAGSINWLLIGLLQYDYIAGFFGFQAALMSRIFYVLFGVGAVYLVLRVVINKGTFKIWERKKKKQKDASSENAGEKVNEEKRAEGSVNARANEEEKMRVEEIAQKEAKMNAEEFAQKEAKMKAEERAYAEEKAEKEAREKEEWQNAPSFREQPNFQPAYIDVEASQEQVPQRAAPEENARQEKNQAQFVDFDKLKEFRAQDAFAPPQDDRPNTLFDEHINMRK